MPSKDIAGELLRPLLNELRETEEELAYLREIEKRGDDGGFREAAASLDRKTKQRDLHRVKRLDERVINPKAFARVRQPQSRDRTAVIGLSLPSSTLLAELFQQRLLKCDCIVPFTWTGLRAFQNMPGPDRNAVYQGILGANREFSGEYTVANYGETTGKGRVSLNGQLHMAFEATVPHGGTWCVLMPAGNLWVQGRTQVIGQGNSTTSYDAKVWVDYYQLLIVGATLVEIAGGQIHYDGTRSENRTRYFENDVSLPQRYVLVNAAGGDRVILSLRLEVETGANEDGTAIAVVDYFGFPANTTKDYDTFLVKA